jgi:hypothetical protein
VAKLEAIANRDIITVKNNDESKGSNATFKCLDNVQTSQGLTTAELAEQTGTNRAAWNNWAKPERIGQVRRHPQAGGWRLVGKAAPPNGGPERWLWQAA